MPIMRDATPAAPTHEINVTPMLDVLLVLLRLFVKADRRLRYDAVVGAMDVARGAGVDVIGWP